MFPGGLWGCQVSGSIILDWSRVPCGGASPGIHTSCLFQCLCSLRVSKEVVLPYPQVVLFCRAKHAVGAQ